MIVKNYISVGAFLVVLLGAYPTSAYASCDMLDRTLNTVSLVRKIQFGSNKQITINHISDLEEQINIISSPDLIPVEIFKQFPKEADSISIYIESLREAIDEAKKGSHQSDKDAFLNSITPEFVNSLGALDRYWGCINAAIHTSNSKALVYDYTPVFRKGAQKSKNTDLYKTSVSHTKVLNRAAVMPVIISRGHLSLLILSSVLLFFSAFLLFQNSSKKLAMREVRQFLYSPVTVLIENLEVSMLMVDISMNGAKIKHSKTIVGQKTLYVKLANNWYYADIKWSNDIFMGVMFKIPLNARRFREITDSYNVNQHVS